MIDILYRIIALYEDGQLSGPVLALLYRLAELGWL